ncbi:FecR domain-containing protein [Brevundimonas nasdae]|uniref:FecR domain-containing protein n=2 Tax=Brevundimonas nasdae TaxID=172043 RepID=A0ABX8TDQ6_9CAUL|nr:FecR domain-containing protein [Brevundimonas nasdae]QYC09311.1 FecR domain-containing protein [Brevundimonas nasdae]QYC15360.1 FecR domain-containing protein [Brevundimonas nasdae]
MSDPQAGKRVADRQAAEWHVRLGKRPVSAATLSAFKVWRETPVNADAYRRVEMLWRSAGGLGADADVQALTRETLKATAPRERAWTRRLIPATALLAGLGAVVLLASFWLQTRNLYSTEVGQHEVIRLADGTQVRLDTDTRVRVQFTGAERQIVLEQGQALFTVAHDADRPFRVSAGATEVTALGTVFDVRRRPEGARVTLLEGVVVVTDADARAGGTWRLRPGQQVETAKSNVTPVAVDAVEVTSWTQGRLVFRGTPLREAVAEINRYLPDKIVLAVGPLADTPVNGVFATGDGDAFVAAVSDLFGLRAVVDADGGVRLIRSSVSG